MANTAIGGRSPGRPGAGLTDRGDRAPRPSASHDRQARRCVVAAPGQGTGMRGGRIERFRERRNSRRLPPHRTVRAPDAAYHRIAPFVRQTPLEYSAELGAYLKLEHWQHTGSFKFRGASNKIALLTAEQ